MRILDQIVLTSFLFAALSVGLVYNVRAGEAMQTNPPSECKAEDSKCDCENGEQVSDGCIKVSPTFQEKRENSGIA